MTVCYIVRRMFEFYLLGSEAVFVALREHLKQELGEMTEDPVYDPPRFFAIERYLTEDGGERLRLSATVHKLRNCDLAEPPWVDFYDADGEIQPPGAMFRADWTPAGTTRGIAGDKWRIEGYTITLPDGMKGRVGMLIVLVPCKLWTRGPGDSKIWGRAIVAEWGPVPVPRQGGHARDAIVLVAPSR